MQGQWGISQPGEPVFSLRRVSFLLLPKMAPISSLPWQTECASEQRALGGSSSDIGVAAGGSGVSSRH